MLDSRALLLPRLESSRLPRPCPRPSSCPLPSWGSFLPSEVAPGTPGLGISGSKSQPSPLWLRPLPALTPPDPLFPVNSPCWTEAQPLLPCDWQEASCLLREGERDSGVSRLDAREGGQAENPHCCTGAVASRGPHLPVLCPWPPSPPTSGWALPASEAWGGFQGNARGWVISIHTE